MLLHLWNYVVRSLVVSVFLMSCAEESPRRSDEETSPPVPNLHFDPELKPYFDSYLADANEAGVPVSESKLMEFQGLMWADHIDLKSSPDAKILGHCQRRHKLSFVELLRPDSNRKAGSTVVDEITLKVMIYHELGHCLHDFSGHTSGKSAAVMNSYLQPARYFDLEGLLKDHFQMLKKVQENPSFRP